MMIFPGHVLAFLLNGKSIKVKKTKTFRLSTVYERRKL
jgi:hypothetical protein